jgi:hypothetical protein
VTARVCARTLSLSLSPSRCLVGQNCWRQTHLHTRSFYRCSVGLARQLVRPFGRSLSLARGSRWSEPSPPYKPPAPRHGRAHVMHFPATSARTRPPLEPTPTHSLPSVAPQPNTLTPSLALRAYRVFCRWSSWSRARSAVTVEPSLRPLPR